MSDPEIDLLNSMLRAELEKFKNADEATRRKVVNTIAEAGALNWLIEVCEDDTDPAIQNYAYIANTLKN